MDRRARGQWGEELAARAYTQKGYRVVEKNYHTRMGEIDLVVEKDGMWIFAEVKTRAEKAPVSGAEAVDYRKQQKIIRAVQYYLAQYNMGEAGIRFDVVEVTHSEKTAPLVHIIPNAFTL